MNFYASKKSSRLCFPACHLSKSAGDARNSLNQVREAYRKQIACEHHFTRNQAYSAVFMTKPDCFISKVNGAIAIGGCLIAKGDYFVYTCAVSIARASHSIAWLSNVIAASAGGLARLACAIALPKHTFAAPDFSFCNTFPLHCFSCHRDCDFSAGFTNDITVPYFTS